MGGSTSTTPPPSHTAPRAGWGAACALHRSARGPELDPLTAGVCTEEGLSAGAELSGPTRWASSMLACWEGLPTGRALVRGPAWDFSRPLGRVKRAGKLNTLAPGACWRPGPQLTCPEPGEHRLPLPCSGKGEIPAGMEGPGSAHTRHTGASSPQSLTLPSPLARRKPSEEAKRPTRERHSFPNGSKLGEGDTGHWV